MKATRSVYSKKWQLYLAAAAFFFILFERRAAMAVLAQDVISHFNQVSDRIELAGSSIIRLDMLPPEAAAICEFLNDQKVGRYDLDPRLFVDNGNALHRTIDTCWPKRLVKGARHRFIPAGVDFKEPGCPVEEIGRGVAHVACEQ